MIKIYANWETEYNKRDLKRMEITFSVLKEISDCLDKSGLTGRIENEALGTVEYLLDDMINQTL